LGVRGGRNAAEALLTIELLEYDLVTMDAACGIRKLGLGAIVFDWTGRLEQLANPGAFEVMTGHGFSFFWVFPSEMCSC
jgi:hypothetical protein